MKITFVLPGIGFSGGIRTVFECSNRLIKRGHTVNIVYPLFITKYHARHNMLEPWLILLRRLWLGQKVRWFKLKATVIRIPYFFPWFATGLPESDVVIATAAETAFFVSGLASKYGKKFYFVQHYEAWELWNNQDCWQQLEEEFGQAGDKSIDMPKIVPRDASLCKYKEAIDATYRLPLRIFTTSSWLKQLIASNFNQKVIGCVSIGNDAKFFSCGAAVNKNGQVVMMPLRGEKWRGDADGLQALEQVRQAFPNIRVVLYGSTLHRNQAPVWAEYHADISDAELKALYCCTDIFILPSWVEGWSSPPMEAMSCHTACVCTAVGATRDYSIPGETALIVPPRDPVSLARACCELLSDGQRRNRIAQAGFEYIQSFTWDKTVDQLERILVHG